MVEDTAVGRREFVLVLVVKGFVVEEAAVGRREFALVDEVVNVNGSIFEFVFVKKGSLNPRFEREGRSYA